MLKMSDLDIWSLMENVLKMAALNQVGCTGQSLWQDPETGIG